MAARYGLGLAHSWASVPVMPVLRASPIGVAIRQSSVRSFSSAKSSVSNRPTTTIPTLGMTRFPSTVITGLRIRHNSTQQQQPPSKSNTDDLETSTTPIPTNKPVDPLTAPPIVVADTPKPPATKSSADTASILKLLSLAKPQWPLLTVGISCLVVSTGVNLGIPWAIGRIIDYFAPGSEATLLFGLPLEQATWALIGVLLVGALANSGRAMALRLAGQRTVARIR